MTEKTKKYKEQLAELLKRGGRLAQAIQYECYGDEFKRRMPKSMKAAEVAKYLDGLPTFSRDYQAWYSEALSLVKQVLPERLEDFKSYYEYRRPRKVLTVENYMIRDYLQGLFVRIGKDTVVDGKAAIPHFEQQINIVRAASVTLDSALIDLTNVLQADVFDSELDSARALTKLGFLRAAGAICGVIIEKHLKQVCDSHGSDREKEEPGDIGFQSGST